MGVYILRSLHTISYSYISILPNRDICIRQYTYLAIFPSLDICIMHLHGNMHLYTYCQTLIYTSENRYLYIAKYRCMLLAIYISILAYVSLIWQLSIFTSSSFIIYSLFRSTVLSRLCNWKLFALY